MNSRYWRTVGSNFIVGTVLEYAVCLCISLLFNSDNYLFYALLIMLAMWAVQIVLWFKNLIVVTIHYYLTGKRQWVGEVEMALRQYEFPIYDSFMPDAVEYLSSVVDDEKSTVKQIAYAAATLGQIEMLKLTKPTVAWRLMFVLEAALDNYRRNPVGAQTEARRGKPTAFRPT